MISSLFYLERYRNEGTRTYSRHSDYSEAELRYRPGSEEETFPLSVFNVPRICLNIYTANPSEELRSRYLDNEHARFCIHPQVLEGFADDPYIEEIKQKGGVAPSLQVIPSSSTRTLYVKSDIPHALKVHFPYRISRYGRKMRDEVIEQAINVSLDLEKGIDYFDDEFAFLREVIGVSYKDLDPEAERGENWGYLVRDMAPFPLLDGDRIYIPGFALYGGDAFDREQPPLLYELIGTQNPLSFVLENLMFPIIRHWIQSYKTFGFMLEPHGQNVLLELNGDNLITRIVHRDLSVGIDMRRRADMGLDSEHLNSYNKMDYGEFCSISYDMFMGSHFFDRVVDCCLQKYSNLSEADFREPCKELFADIFPEHEAYLPEEVHYFSEKRDQFNKPLYKNTGQKPAWRP